MSATIKKMLVQVKWRLFRAYESLSLLGKVGLFLILATLLVYYFIYQPQRKYFASLQLDSMMEQQPTTSKPAPHANLNQYISEFPSLATRASKLNQLVEIAKQQQLLLNEVTYKTESNIHQPINRYQVELSVLASYPAIHHFISSVLQKMPFVAIESLNLSRESRQDEAVEARIVLTFFFKRS
jgi:hypothetical protein